MIEAELPDGTVLEFPEGTSPDIVQKAVKSRLGVASPKAETPSFGQMLKDQIIGSAPVQLGMGAVRGAGSIGATLLAPVDMAKDALAGKGLSLESNRQRRAAMDEALSGMGADTSGFAYNAGKIGGEIAGTAGIPGVLAKGAQGLGAAPALIQALHTGGMSAGGLQGAKGLATRTIAGALTGGATAGLVNPEDAGTGMVVGGALPIITKTAGAAGQKIGNALRPSQDTIAAAQKAQKYGIPVGLGDVAENRGIQAARSILRDAPISGGMAQNAREAQQQAFNAAVGKTFGAPEKKLTLDVLDSAKQKLGSEFDRIWNNNVLSVDPKMIDTLESVKTQASKLPRNEGGAVLREIDDLYSRMVPDANGNLQIPGDVANKFQSYLRRRAESFPALSDEFTKLRRSILDTFNASVAPADAAALTLNRSQYKAFKTVEPLLRSSELGVAGRSAGDVPAALLPNAVNKSYGNLKGAELADLAQVGSRFIVDRTPQTGGSARAALQNTAIGAALMGTGGVPALAAGVPSAIGLQKVMQSKALAQALMGQGASNPVIENALRQSILAAPVFIAQ